MKPANFRTRLPVAALLAFTAMNVATAARAADTAADAEAAQSGAAADAAADSDLIIVTGRLARFGATKSETPILETARSVTIVDTAWIGDTGALSLDDALGYVAGVTAEPFGNGTRGDFPTVRGLSVPEYRDNLQFLFGFYNNPRPELYALEQVEVLKGPASVLYGQGSPGGIVNVVTKRPFDDQVAEILGKIGNFNRYEVAADINSSIAGTGGTMLGRIVGLYRNSGTQIAQVDEEKILIAPAITARPTPGTKITLLANYTKQNTDAAHQFYPVTGTLLPPASRRTIDPTAYFGEPGFNRYNSESVSVTLIGEQKLTEAISLEGVARYMHSTSDYRQAWPVFVGTGRPRIDANGNTRRSFFAANRGSEQMAFDIRARANFDTGLLSHEVLAGVQYQDVSVINASAYLYGFSPFNVFRPVYGGAPTAAQISAAMPRAVPNKTKTRGVYVSDQIKVGNLIANAGVRFDSVRNQPTPTAPTQKDSATSFSAGLLYKFASGFAPYASFAQSFQPVVGVDTLTRQPLKPQRGRQFEAGIKYQPPGTNAYFTLAAFDIRQSNLANPNALQGANSQQEGVAKIRGGEFEALARIGGWSVNASASYLDAKDPNGFRLSTIPKFQAAAFVTYSPPNGPLQGLRIGGGLRHVGSSESGGTSVLTGRRIVYVTPAYTVADALIGYQIGRWDISVNARNLANKTYFTTCLARGDCYPAEKRTVVGRVAVRF